VSNAEDAAKQALLSWECWIEYPPIGLSEYTAESLITHLVATGFKIIPIPDLSLFATNDHAHPQEAPTHRGACRGTDCEPSARKKRRAEGRKS
jgi:hypothetical protein